jgi:signal transduction histidine kinase
MSARTARWVAGWLAAGSAKYAHATQARICLQAHNGSLRFTVSDDGTGYDARHIPMGSGLRNMADRLAALGSLEVRSAPAHGTTITGHLPTVPPPAAMIRS